jgi:hypothetical protein
MNYQRLTIEVFGTGNGDEACVLDRVIGGTCYLDEATRIGHHLLSSTEGSPSAFRVLNQDNQPLYEWHLGNAQKT